MGIMLGQDDLLPSWKCHVEMGVSCPLGLHVSGNDHRGLNCKKEKTSTLILWKSCVVPSLAYS